MATLTPDGKKIELAYLFKAEFRDGTIITQNADDQSALEGSRSCFFDVLQAIEQGKEPVRFTLEGNGHTWAIDLTDGHFEHNGAPFFMHEQIDLVDFRIIYFRVRDNHFNQAWNFVKGDVSYRIGWQANDKEGKNHQHYIEVR